MSSFQALELLAVLVVKNDQTTVFWTYSSFDQPISIHKLNLDTQETTKTWEAEVPIDLDNLTV